MAPRPAWKGYLKLSLVTCAVELSNVVTHAEKVTFHILNRETGNRVKRIYVDAETGDPVEPEVDSSTRRSGCSCAGAASRSWTWRSAITKRGS